MEKAGMRFVGEATHYGFTCVKFERLRSTHLEENKANR